MATPEKTTSGRTLRGRVRGPLSGSTLAMLWYGGVILPVLCHLFCYLVVPSTATWQSGDLADQLSFVMTGRAGFYFYPLVVFSTASLAWYLLKDTGSSPLSVRIGLWCGVLLSLWYTIMSAIVFYRADVQHPQTIAWVFVGQFLLLCVPVVLWGAFAFAGEMGRQVASNESVGKMSLVVLYFFGPMLIGAIVALAQGSGDGTWIAFMPYFAPLAISVFAGPIWSLAAYSFVVTRVLLKEPEARRFSLLSLMGAVTCIAAFLAACRQAIITSLEIYRDLPTTQGPVHSTYSQCYVVSAAANGHRCVVGTSPSSPINRQLRRFKALELVLRTLLPCAHQRLRFIYDHVGPVMARCIGNPWLADAAYLSLKPAEWITAAILLCILGRRRSVVDELYGPPCPCESVHD